jgi:sulfur-oxidizing protein SoxY
MRLNRRAFIEGGLALLALLGIPATSRGDAWPKAAFEATAAPDALQALFGSERPRPSEAVALGAPLVAEDGSVVPVSVRTELPGVRSISLVADRNPRPLVAHFELAPGTLPEIACRIKMAETSELHAIVQTDAGLFSATARVKITNGGCA